MNDDEVDEKTEFAPADEIVFRLDRVTDDLDTVGRLLADRELAAAVAHVQAKIEKGTN